MQRHEMNDKYAAFIKRVKPSDRFVLFIDCTSKDYSENLKSHISNDWQCD